MPMFQNLEILETMVHEIPRGRPTQEPDGGLTLSANPTSLGAETDRFVRESMLLPALQEAREIIDVDGTGLVPKLVRDVLDDPSLLPEHSRAIAQHLHGSQSGIASAGVFMASIVELDGMPRLAILKAEHQEGVRLQQVPNAKQVAFSVEHIKELIVGKNSKVYKIAVLWVRPGSDTVVGLMVDKQNGAAYAEYFLTGFLDMRLAHDAEVLTKSFVDTVTNFIDSDGFSSEKQKRYATALTATLESQDGSINPSQFISTFLDAEDRDHLESVLPSEVQVPFKKDTKQVQALVGGVRFLMPGGNVSVTATTKALEDGEVVLDQDGPNGPRVIIKGDPDTVKLARPPKK